MAVFLSVSLPDPDSVLWRQIERICGFDIEGAIPGIQIAHSQGPVVAGSMTIGGNALAHGLISHLGCPSLGITDKETLITAKTANNRRFFALE